METTSRTVVFIMLGKEWKSTLLLCSFLKDSEQAKFV